jgi:hypothetical protein
VSSLRTGIILHNQVTACGDPVTGTATWSGNDRGREVVAALYLRTEGRGDLDTLVVARARLGKAPGGEANFSLPVPIEGPVTYHGSLLRVMWHVALTIPPKGTPPRPGKNPSEVTVSVVPWGWNPPPLR